MSFSSVVIIGRHFEKKRATAMGVSLSGAGFGSLLIAPLIAILRYHYGSWKGSMLITSGLMLNCVVLSLLYAEREPVAKKSEDNAKTDSVVKQSPLKGQTDDNEVEDQESDTKLTASHLSEDESAFVLRLHASVSTVGMVHERHWSRFADRVRYLIDIDVCTNYVYMMFNIANFILSLGMRVPFVYIPHLAVERGLATEEGASFFLAIVGISNTLSRVAIGLWADRTSISRLHIFNVILLISGLANFTISFLNEYYQMALYSTVFGACFGKILQFSLV